MNSGSSSTLSSPSGGTSKVSNVPRKSTSTTTTTTSNTVSYIAIILAVVAIVVALILGIIFLVFRTNAQGPVGPEGPKGATGDTGATGPEGPQGPPGDSATEATQVAEFSINANGALQNPTQVSEGGLFYVNNNRNYGSVGIDTVNFNIGASFKVVALRPFYIQGSNLNISTYTRNVNGTGDDTGLGKALCPNQAVNNNTFYFPLGFVYTFTKIFATNFTMDRTSNAFLPTNIFNYGNTSDQLTPSYLRLVDNSNQKGDSITLTDNGWYTRNTGSNGAQFRLDYDFLFPGDTWTFDTSTGNLRFIIRWTDAIANAGYRIGIVNRSIDPGNNVTFVDEINIGLESKADDVFVFRVAGIHHPPTLEGDNGDDFGYVLITQYSQKKFGSPRT